MVAARQVGDGEGELEDAVVGARRELQLVHGGAYQGAAGLVQLAELAYLRRAHIGVASDGTIYGRMVICSLGII